MILKAGTVKFHEVQLTAIQSNDALIYKRTGYRNDSRVHLEFLFERQTGFFLLQIYTPLTLIVFCSWVSFWLVKTEAVRKPPRVISYFCSLAFYVLHKLFFTPIYQLLLALNFCCKSATADLSHTQGGEVPARTALGATTVLSIVNLGFGGKSKPKVGLLNNYFDIIIM